MMDLLEVFSFIGFAARIWERPPLFARYYIPAQQDCYLFKITLYVAGAAIQGHHLLHLDAAELRI